MQRDMKFAPGVSGSGMYLSRRQKAGMFAQTVSALQRKEIKHVEGERGRLLVPVLSKIIMTVLLAIILVVPVYAMELLLKAIGL